MSSQVKKLLLFSLKSLALILVLDFCIGFALAKLYSKMRAGEKAQTYHFLNKSNAEIFILGSSKALYHYNPTILSDSLNLTCYNAGRAGQSILFHTALLKAKIKNSKPHVVILDLLWDEFRFSEKKYEMLNALMPYYHSHTEIQHAINAVNPTQKFWSWSRTYPYNSALFSILYRSLIDKRQSEDNNGHLTRNTPFRKTGSLVETSIQNTIPDTVLVSALEEFIHLCKTEKIKLYIFVSPSFTTPRKSNHLKFIEEKLIGDGAYFKDFSQLTAFHNNTAYFFDEGHLNANGANFYTSLIVDFINLNP